MTSQEILTSLSTLEQELNNVKAARILAEDTINSYKNVQKEIKSFFSEFETVIHSLNIVATEFQAGQSSLSNDTQDSIAILKTQIENINTSFSNKCHEIIADFQNGLNTIHEQFQNKSHLLTAEYEANNKSFETSISELVRVHAALIKAIEHVTSLKSSILDLQSELKDSQTEQDGMLEQIATEIHTTRTSQTESVSKLEDNIKVLQVTFNSQCATIKSLLNKGNDTIDILIKAQSENAQSISEGISHLLSQLDSTANNIIQKCEDIAYTSNSTKIFVITNFIATLIAISVAFLK